MRWVAIFLTVFASIVAGQPTTATTRPAASRPQRQPPRPAVTQGREGRLEYMTAANGDRLPDYSYAGFAAGAEAIPMIPTRLVVPLIDGDATNAIQAAIDEVAKLATDDRGFRGAVLLLPGEYRVEGTLRIAVSGVVLRGSGFVIGGTTLRGTGVGRRAVIDVRGSLRDAAGDEARIVDAYVPVGATRFRTGGTTFKVGDTVVIKRPSTAEWIDELGMVDFGGDRHGPSWRPGSRDLAFDRTITAVDGDAITIDAPLTIAIDARYGSGTVATYAWPERVRNVGVENFRIVSSFDEKNPKDEEHAWYGVAIANARDVWVRRIACENLVGSAVVAWDSASRVTVEDCLSLHPVGEIGGWRRYAFFTTGQQVLMQRLQSESGYHDFAVGFGAAGPNAFVQCEAVNALAESGAIDSVACGTLFDRVRIDRQPLTLTNQTYKRQGAGWTSFNGCIWNSVAPLIELGRPPMAQNWAFGAHGEFDGNGAFTGSNDDVDPDSLYYAQLADRIGADAAKKRAMLNLPPVQGTRAPTLENAAEAIAVTMRPRVTMRQWIERANDREPIDAASAGLKRAEPIKATEAVTTAKWTLSAENGWLVMRDANGATKLATGGQIGVPYWSGSIRGAENRRGGQPALTRFVPGRDGTGTTDDLAAVVADMKRSGTLSIFQHPPLWYERRRDDHERVQRLDGDVIAPFYETPWARSGTGTASDGLTKWDLTKPNPWYYGRLRTFAELAAENGRVLFSGMYMQHSVLEAGAHYADYPWRTANNINDVGLPEPVFFAGDKLIYIAEQFYDLSHAGRRELHRQYIRQHLAQLAESPNVVFYLSEEYTGPLAFTEFWLDTIAEWKADTGKSPMIALYATKDVTDAILSDPKRAAVVSMIFNRFNHEGDTAWWVQPDGKWYAPQGGKNLSPRQWIRLLKPKMAGAEQVYRVVSEYREKYPNLPFFYEGPKEFAWAALLGGGSMANVKLPPELAAAVIKMRPVKHERDPLGHLTMELGGPNALLSMSDHDLSINSTTPLRIREIDPRTGDIRNERVEGRAGVNVLFDLSAGTIVWQAKAEAR